MYRDVASVQGLLSDLFDCLLGIAWRDVHFFLLQGTVMPDDDHDIPSLFVSPPRHLCI